MKTSMPAAAGSERAWELAAVRRIEADFQRSSDTHLIPLHVPGWPQVDLYLKDESSHPTGSLKHRLARSLFLYALCNGWLREGTSVVEASSGSTAISEAYFARLLSLPFVAVMPAVDLDREDRRDRVPGRALPSGRRSDDHRQRIQAAGRRTRRPLPRPIHLRRARHRLAREQQHRRVHLSADAP
jgi:hypothetical protein